MSTTYLDVLGRPVAVIYCGGAERGLVLELRPDAWLCRMDEPITSEDDGSETTLSELAQRIGAGAELR